MRRREPVEAADLPAEELLRYREPDGRPWSSEGFKAWLRARARYRATHSEPLPGLRAFERAALPRMGVPEDLLEGERRASLAAYRGRS